MGGNTQAIELRKLRAGEQYSNTRFGDWIVLQMQHTQSRCSLPLGEQFRAAVVDAVVRQPHDPRAPFPESTHEFAHCGSGQVVVVEIEIPQCSQSWTACQCTNIGGAEPTTVCVEHSQSTRRCVCESLGVESRTGVSGQIEERDVRQVRRCE